MASYRLSVANAVTAFMAATAFPADVRGPVLFSALRDWLRPSPKKVA
jgi:hypothetical protein